MPTLAGRIGGRQQTLPCLNLTIKHYGRSFHPVKSFRGYAEARKAPGSQYLNRPPRSGRPVHIQRNGNEMLSKRSDVLRDLKITALHYTKVKLLLLIQCRYGVYSCFGGASGHLEIFRFVHLAFI